MSAPTCPVCGRPGTITECMLAMLDQVDAIEAERSGTVGSAPGGIPPANDSPARLGEK